MSTQARAANLTWTIAVGQAYPPSGGGYDPSFSNFWGSFDFDADTNTFSNLHLYGGIFPSTDTVAVGGASRLGTTTVSAVGVSSGAPEPGSILLGGSGMLGFALLQLRRRLAK